MIKPISHAKQDIGKNIKSSKKKYTWNFLINSSDHLVELFASFLTGKKQIIHNNK